MGVNVPSGGMEEIVGEEVAVAEARHIEQRVDSDSEQSQVVMQRWWLNSIIEFLWISFDITKSLFVAKFMIKYSYIDWLFL